MNQHNNDHTWAQAGSDPTSMGLDMHDIADDDFANFLNPEYLGSDFTNLGSFDGGQNVTQPPFGESLVQSTEHHGFDQTAQFFGQSSRPTTSGHSGPQQPFGPPSISAFDTFAPGQFAQQDHNDALENAMRGALPTPNSSELYGKNHEYMRLQQQMQQARHHQQQQMHQGFQRPGIDLNIFTPYESPGTDGMPSAMSYIPDYNPPGSFALSPIPSPAMNPQIRPNQTPRSAPRTAGSSLGASPSNERLEVDPEAIAGQAEERPRKSRKKAAPATRSTTSGMRTRKATANNTTRKDSLNVHIPPKGGAGSTSAKALQGKDRMILAGPTSAPRLSDSAESSLSPRLSIENSMAPPPKPSSTVTTPTQATPRRSGESTNDAPNPATPASMMKDKTSARTGSGRVNSGDDPTRIQQSPSTSTLESHMEFLSLPEAAASGSGSSSNSQSRNENATVRPPPHLVDSNSESPRPASSVTSPVGPVGMQESESKGGRGSKKRNSSGSNLVSPALRPRVSPGMKPLLPGGSGFDAQTQALLLASKSNYENILSGNHPEGVSYPPELGANLSSKRTSHKLAEQGRRNRINDALKELQTLFPPKFADKVKEAEGSGSGGNNQKQATAIQSGNSKAATVENAIEYIKALQEENEILKGSSKE